MNEIKQLKKLMEAVQLNEYLVNQGEPISAVLQLNLWTDAESRPSEYEEAFRNSPEWMAVENKYYALAAKLEAMVASSGVTLDDLDVDEIHNVWYDGSDAYDDPEEAVHSLPGIYDAQINVVQDILTGGGQDDIEETVIGERQSIAHEPEHYDIATGSEGISILKHSGEPVLEMPMDDWIALISKFNRNYRPR